MDNIHSEILGLLVEINQHLLCFMAQGVPREDVPLLKENYIKLMQRVEELSKEHKFLNVFQLIMLSTCLKNGVMLVPFLTLGVF